MKVSKLSYRCLVCFIGCGNQMGGDFPVSLLAVPDGIDYPKVAEEQDGAVCER